MPQHSTPEHVYVHVPFCARRCSYCDFSIAVRHVTPVDEYITALTAELAQYDTSHWNVQTLYFGGGTPSRLGGHGIERAIVLFRTAAHIAPTAEITIEANPDDVTASDVRAWTAAGVNRVSLGVQSFDDAVLTWMHRTHTASQIRTAVQTLRDAGIDNISIDLIFALPQELQRDWRADLDRVLTLDPRHISLYGLTVESHTPLGRWRARGEIHEASEDTYEREFLEAHTRLEQAGFEHYEVSNYGRPGFHSRHNSSYWSGVPYVGLGPSAHSFMGDTRFWNVAPYAEWTRRLAAGSSPVDARESLSDQNRDAERVYLGLRTSRGLSATDAELAAARSWADAGWAIIQNGTIVLTPAGWLRLDALAASLTVAGSR
jgi:oxygen-independent coproporphyrinogen-3 oxidase